MAAPTIPNGEEHFFPIIYEGTGTGRRVGKFVPFTNNGTIANSVIYNRADTPKLARTPGSNGNRKTFTISVWYKPTDLGTDRTIISADTSASGTNYAMLKLNTNNCYEIGKNIAKLHKASKKIKLYRKNSLSLKEWPKLLNRIGNKSKTINSSLDGLMKNSFLQIKNKWPKNLPYGIIHADLFIDNIFFKKNKFHGYIDFYFACNDFLMYEIAICINALCFDKKNNKFIFNKKKSSNLIRGYSKIRRFSDKEKKSLNILCKGAALRYLLTRTYDYLNTPKSAVIKIKNPREYIQKLKVHNQFNNFKNYYN